METSHLRNIAYNIELRVYAILRFKKWVVQKNNMPTKLVVDPLRPRTYETTTSHQGFCWMTEYDANTYPAVTRNFIVLKAGSTVIAQDKYTINFVDNTVSVVGGYTLPAGSLTISALCWSTRVVQGYPDPERLDVMDLPSIAWDIDSQTDKPFAIGTAELFRNHYITVDILARSRGEQFDLLDDMQTMFRMIPYLNLKDHQPLLSSGGIDTAFNFADQQIGVIPQVHKPKGSLIPPRQGGSDKERYRGIVSIETEQVV